MGQATRTTKLFLDLENRAEGGANSGKRASLEETARLLDTARAFYVAFFLAHADKLVVKVRSFSEALQEERERLLSPTSCSPGPNPSPWQQVPIPIRCPATILAHGSLISRSSTAAP
jgi:hypothetical protein